MKTILLTFSIILIVITDSAYADNPFCEAKFVFANNTNEDFYVNYTSQNLGVGTSDFYARKAPAQSSADFKWKGVKASFYLQPQIKNEKTEVLALSADGQTTYYGQPCSIKEFFIIPGRGSLCSKYNCTLKTTNNDRNLVYELKVDKK